MWGSTFEDHWLQGGGRPSLEALLLDLRAQGFEFDFDYQNFEAVTAREINAFRWPKIGNLKSVADASFGKDSWGYLAASTKLKWPRQFAFLIAHIQRRADKAPDAQGVVLWTQHPEAVLDFILRKCHEPEWTGKSASLPKHVRAEDNVVVGPDCEFGAGTILEAGVRIGARVKIAANCRIGAHTRISDDCIIGEGTHLAAHNVIGGQGFGLFDHPKAPHRRSRLHVGHVEIGKNNRFASFIGVDRAVFGVTRVGDNCCLDSHIHIGHNCEVGNDNVFCANVGLAGSTIVGDRCTFAGLVATKGHLKIGSDVVIGAQSGVSAPLEDGAHVKGYPPRPMAEALKIASLQSRLPEIYERLKGLEKTLKEKFK